MLSINARRAVVQNLFVPRRWLSSRPTNTRRHSWDEDGGPSTPDYFPRPGRDKSEFRRAPSQRSGDGPHNGHKKFVSSRPGSPRYPPKRFDGAKGGGYRSDRGGDNDFSRRPAFQRKQVSEGNGGQRGGMRDNKSWPQEPQMPPDFEPRLPDKPQIPLIPELPQEETDKIAKTVAIYEAKSIYFVPPERTSQPEPGANQSVGEATNAGSLVVLNERDPALARASKFFMAPAAKLAWIACTFKQHPINTTTPEICVIGASNCGKSSFINALVAGSPKTHARVSARAGRTVSMNAYGVGSVGQLPVRKPVSPDAAGEKPTGHGLILVDTPGYGFASKNEWGRQIMDYIKKRTMLRGVVLLMAAEKKITRLDRQVMSMLAQAGRPVMVVFTKLDKAPKPAQLRSERAREEGGIAQRLRDLEQASVETGWNGWMPRVHLTASRIAWPKGKRDPTHSWAGMAGVRLSILDLVGLKQFVVPGTVKPKVQTGGEALDEGGNGEKREEPGKALESDPAAWSGDVVSFEELEKTHKGWSD